MSQISCLNLEIAEDCKYFGQGHCFTDSQDIENTWNVLLDIKLNAQRLECYVFDSPQVSHLTVGVAFKFGHTLQEAVYICDIVIENLLSWIS